MREVVAFPPDHQIDRMARRKQALGQAQERGADSAAAKAPEQERDAAVAVPCPAQASASMLMVRVRRSLPAGPCIGATECQELKVLTNSTH